MNPIRKFLGQTAIYGLSTIVGRLLNFLLVPLYVSLFDPAEYGKVTYLYALVVFLIVLLTYGMETTFFRFREKGLDLNKVYATGAWSLIGTSLLFLFIALGLNTQIAAALNFEGNPEYINWFAWILVLDAVVALPFAQLRANGRPWKFAWVKLTNIGLNVGLNLFFLLLLPWLTQFDNAAGHYANLLYNPDFGVGYVFIANLVASAVTFLLLIPESRGLTAGFSLSLWKQMIRYSWPLMIAGLASAVNEVADRQIMNFVLPEDEAFTQIGIYGACYKLSIFMTLFIQAYRYGAEPFFFAKSGDHNAKETYAKLMNIFVIAVAVIYVGLNLFLEPLSRWFIPNTEYYEGLHIVPVLLLANLCLGIYINLSVWYKLTDQTRYGAIISGIGAVLTIAFNFWAIPKFGYTGAAWVTLGTYATMMIISLLWGQRNYPIPYDYQRMFGYLFLAVGIVAFARFVMHNDLLMNSVLFLIFAAVLTRIEIRQVRRWFKNG